MAAGHPPAVEPSEAALRTALGRFVTGVTIVSCIDGQGKPVGLTVNSFNALSLDPALVLWSLRSASPSLEAFAQAKHFAINVLAEDQANLSRRFASPVPHKFDEGIWHKGHGGVPVLSHGVAVFECEQMSHQEAGDHMLFIGRVLRVATEPKGPLVFHARHYHSLGEKL